MADIVQSTETAHLAAVSLASVSLLAAQLSVKSEAYVQATQPVHQALALLASVQQLLVESSMEAIVL
jgi:negative regulator of sigma E activity